MVHQVSYHTLSDWLRWLLSRTPKMFSRTLSYYYYYYYRKKRFRWRNVHRLQGHLTNAKTV